jgi:ABC-type Fe3+ transport system permease subunit
MSVDGSFNLLFHEILHIWPSRIVLEGFAAVIFVQTLHFFSLTYLSAYSAFLNIDPTLEESAENLGAKGFGLFRKVTLPLALPGIEAGAILTFILSVEDLGTLVVYSGWPQVRKTLTFAIFNNIIAPTGDVQGVATAMGVILLLIAIIGFLFIRRYMSLRHYAMLSKGGTWNPRLSPSKWYHYLIFYGFIIGILTVALIPHAGIFLLALAAPGSWGRTVIPSQFTLANFGIIFIDPDIFGSIINSLVYSGTAVFIIILVGTSAAYLVARKNIPGKNWIDLLVTIPIALPGIVIAIGYLLFFSRDPIFSTFLSPLILGAPATLITMSYAIRKMPFTVRSTFAGLQQTHVELEEAASNLGASRFLVFRKIVIPLIGISILAGAMMSFVYCMSEVSTSLILGDISAANGPITWKMYVIYNALAMGPSLAAVMGIFLMILQIIVMAITNLVLKRRSAAMIGL